MGSEATPGAGSPRRQCRSRGCSLHRWPRAPACGARHRPGSFPLVVSRGSRAHPNAAPTEPAMSPLAEVMRPEVEGRPYGTQIRVLAESYPDMVAVTMVDEAGGATRLDWRTLDRRSNQVARAFAAEGIGRRRPGRPRAAQLRRDGRGRAGLLEDRRLAGTGALGPSRLGAGPGGRRVGRRPARRPRPRRAVREVEVALRRTTARGGRPCRQRHLLERVDGHAQDHHGPQPSGHEPLRGRCPSRTTGA